MLTQIKGTGVAIVTPFKSDKTVDFEGLANLVEHLVVGGVDYLVVMGTTGESVTLTDDEKKQIIKTVVQQVNQRIPVVLGIGGNYTEKVLSNFSKFHFEGISAILSVSPYYNKPSQEGIYQHYKAISNESPVPIILYNVPGRTGSNILASTTVKLAKDFKNIVAIKEASADLNQMSKIKSLAPSDFMLISGDDALTVPIIAIGGIGVISVVANAFPKEFSKMVRLAMNNQYAEAQVIHYQLLKFTDLIFKEGNPGGIKAALEILGVCQKNVRLPLVPISSTLYAEIEEEIKVIKNQSK
jgi:4-hydroxy-tetrahydrodipicolinate synthase